ncbi:MAG: Coenzyme F420 hydrogenase/dehydrogenase, beta subunit C-terminal domain [PS1 clade bacterium]|jgi:coenzyme F420 hydrogenase subunit beta
MALINIQQIINEGLCIGCGLCASIFPEKVSIGLSIGGLRPIEKVPLIDEEFEYLCRVCPGVVHSGMPKKNLSEDVYIDPVWGPIERICAAHASNDSVRYKSATGGVLTALAGYLVESNRVDAILHVGSSGLKPYFGHSTISYTLSEVNENCSSIYASTSPLDKIIKVLDEGIRVALVAKPCDISTMRLLAKKDPRVDKYIPLMLSPFCGGFFPPFAMSNFLKSENVTEEEVESVSYRGNGCPGPTSIKLDNGSRIEKSYLDFWGKDSSQWHMPWRCRICPDGTGEGADISTGDTWPECTPTEEMISNDLGTNTVIARTSKGAELLQLAEESGYLDIDYECISSDMDKLQPHLAKKKIKALARFDGMRSCGQAGLSTVDLRSDLLSQTTSYDEFIKESKGTAARIKEGKHLDGYKIK